MGLATKSVSEKKHLHYNPGQLTETGRKFCKHNKDKLQFYLDGINLTSKPDFESDFETRKKEYHSEWETSYERYEILQGFGIPKVDCMRSRQKIEFKIVRFKFIANEGEFWTFEFQCSVKCSRCNNEFNFNITLKYSENEYRPLNFDKICPNCGFNFHCDALFSRFSMD